MRAKPQPDGRNGHAKRALEARADVGAGGFDEVLAGVVQLCLIELNEGRGRCLERLPNIAEPLHAHALRR